MTRATEPNIKNGKNSISFASDGSKVAGNLYYPGDFDANKQYPAIVVGGPLGTVKEQAAGVFAESLAKRRGGNRHGADHARSGESSAKRIPRFRADP